MGKHWLEALKEAVNQQFPDGVCGKGLRMMSDNGSQPTSEAYMEAYQNMEIHQAFTIYNNPKGNVDAERVFRTMKEELLWLTEWTSRLLVDALKAMIQNYNGEYLHSALGYKSPKILRRSTGIAILLSQLALTMPDGTELKILKEFFEANQHSFVFIFLPVYSTELNPIEKVRWITRRKVTHNQYFLSIEDFRMALES